MMSATALTPPTRRRRQRLLASLAAAVCAVAIGACGSSGRKDISGPAVSEAA
jgi:hypothetical protein